MSARTGLDYGNGELGQLAESFDEMAAALEQRQIEHRHPETALKHSHHVYHLYRQGCITAGADYFFSKTNEFEMVSESLKRIVAHRQVEGNPEVKMPGKRAEYRCRHLEEKALENFASTAGHGGERS